MIEAYKIGTTLTLKDEASKKLESFTKMAASAAKAVSELNLGMTPLQEHFAKMQTIFAEVNPTIKATSTSFVGLSKSVEPNVKFFSSLNSKMGSTIARTETLSSKVGTLTEKLTGLGAVTSRLGFRGVGAGGVGGGGGYGFHAGHILREGGLGKLALLGGVGYAGGIGMAAGLGGAMLLKSSYDNATLFQQAQAQMAGQGFGAAANQQAAAAAVGMRIRGVSSAEALQAINDAATVTRNIPSAIALAPLVAKMEMANKINYGMKGKQFTNQDEMRMLQFAELRTGSTDPAVIGRALNQIEQAYATDAARLSTNDLRTFGRQGASFVHNLSDNDFAGLLPLIQSMGGNRVATGLNTMQSSLFKGQNMRTGKRAVAELERLGVYDASGHLKAQYADQVAHAPLEFVHDTLVPLMAKKGITTEAQQAQEFSVLFTQSTVRVMQQIMAMWPRVYAQMQMLPQASGVQAGYNSALATNPGHVKAFQASWETLMTNLGKFSSPMVNSGMDALIYFFDHVSVLLGGGNFSKWLQNNHPTLAKINNWSDSGGLAAKLFHDKSGSPPPVVNVHAQINTVDGDTLGKIVLKNILSNSQLAQNSMPSGYSPAMSPSVSAWSGR